MGILRRLQRAEQVDQLKDIIRTMEKPAEMLDQQIILKMAEAVGWVRMIMVEMAKQEAGELVVEEAAKIVVFPPLLLAAAAEAAAAGLALLAAAAAVFMEHVAVKAPVVLEPQG